MGEHTVFIVDDDEAVTRSLANAVRAMGLPAETYPAADVFIKSYDASRSGCLVLDYKLPGRNGLDLQEQLIALGSLLPVVMISGHATVEVVVRAMKNGAIDFLPKPFHFRQLSNAIRSALELDASRRQELAERCEAGAKIAELTQKEREVLRFVAAGNTNQEIAVALDLSVRAVEDRRARMMKKLGVDGLAGLIALNDKALLPSDRYGDVRGLDRPRDAHDNG